MFHEGLKRGGSIQGYIRDKTSWADIASGEAAHVVNDVGTAGFRHMFRLGKEILAVVNMGFVYQKNLPIRTEINPVLTRSARLETE